MTVSAVSPWRMAFRLERRLPDSVLGPVLRRAFCRFAFSRASTHLDSIVSRFQLSKPMQLQVVFPQNETGNDSVFNSLEFELPANSDEADQRPIVENGTEWREFLYATH